MTSRVVFAEACFLLLYGRNFVAMKVTPKAAPNRRSPKSSATEAVAPCGRWRLDAMDISARP